MIYTLSSLSSLILYLTAFAVSAYISNTKIQFVFGKKKMDSVKVFFIIIIPVIIGGIRYNVGADYLNYYDGYKNLSQIPLKIWAQNFDFFNSDPIGLYIVAKIAAKFNSSQLYFGILCLLMYLPIVLSIKKCWNKIDMGLALFTYLISTYMVGFNIIKQTIAISFVFYGFRYIFERKPIKYCLTILVAMLFHSTVFVVIPLYFLWNVSGKVNRIKKILVFIGTVAVIFFAGNVTERMGGKWSILLESQGSSNIIFFLMLAWLIVFICLRNELIKIDKRNEFLIIVFAIGVIFQATGFYTLFAKRLGNYFFVVQIILMAELPEIFNAKSKELTKLIIITYDVLYLIVCYMFMNQAVVFPYAVITK